MNKSQEQMMNVLDYLKELGIPCEVTLEYLDFPRVKVTDTINININERPDKPMMDVFKKTSDSYQMKIKVGNMVVVLKKYRTKHNQKIFEDIKYYVKKNFSEYIINHKRKKVLDDILDDTNPPILV